MKIIRLAITAALLTLATAACAQTNVQPYRPVVVNTNGLVVSPTNAITYPTNVPPKIGVHQIATVGDISNSVASATGWIPVSFAQLQPGIWVASNQTAVLTNAILEATTNLFLGSVLAGQVFAGMDLTVIDSTNRWSTGWTDPNHEMLSFGMRDSNHTPTGGRFETFMDQIGAPDSTNWVVARISSFSHASGPWTKRVALEVLDEASGTTVVAEKFKGDGSGITGVIYTNLTGALSPANFVAVGSLTTTLSNYTRIVSAPTNYTASGAAGQVAFGWMTGTNFLFWYDTTSNRWQRARAEVWP